MVWLRVSVSGDGIFSDIHIDERRLQIGDMNISLEK